MGLKLMYITNRPEIATLAQYAGVDRLFVDMEYIGKKGRQLGRDTVLSHHTLDDVKSIRKIADKSQLMVRVNPIHGPVDEIGTSEDEIDAVIAAGTDIVMLPFFKTADEVRKFIEIVNGRAKTMLLFETPESVDIADEILGIEGIDEVFIGLNDLSLGYGEKFLFEPLADGTVERLCKKFSAAGKPYGFGGIASLGRGILPSEYIITEHYRLGSSAAILSRSFYNANTTNHVSEIGRIFINGIAEIRGFEFKCAEHLSNSDMQFFENNHDELVKKVRKISENM